MTIIRGLVLLQDEEITQQLEFGSVTHTHTQTHRHTYTHTRTRHMAAYADTVPWLQETYVRAQGVQACIIPSSLALENENSVQGDLAKLKLSGRTQDRCDPNSARGTGQDPPIPRALEGRALRF